MNVKLSTILILIMAQCIFLISCNEELIKKWAKSNYRASDIELERKGENGVGGNYLIESSSKQDSGSSTNEYYLKNQKGQTHKLDLELNRLKYQILYFEFTPNSLFIVIHSFASQNWISIKNFNLETGALEFSDGGAIPCARKIKTKDPWKTNYDWRLGNPNCEWINFQSKQVSYLRSSLIESGILEIPLLETNIFSYNWLDNRIDTLPQNFSVGIDAVTGDYLGLRDIKYNPEKKQFEYNNDD